MFLWLCSLLSPVKPADCAFPWVSDQHHHLGKPELASPWGGWVTVSVFTALNYMWVLVTHLYAFQFNHCSFACLHQIKDWIVHQSTTEWAKRGKNACERILHYLKFLPHWQWLNNHGSINLPAWNIYGSHSDQIAPLARTLESWGYRFVGLTNKFNPYMPARWGRSPSLQILRLWDLFSVNS